MGFLTLSLDSEVAVRLADEGVPLRVIARATRIPSSELREALTSAKTDGRLLALPQDDWSKEPVKANGSSQEAQFARVQADDQPRFLFTIQRLFKVTPIQATLLLTLLQRSVLPKEHAELGADSLAVHICQLRQKLKPFKIKILTVWGYGYQLPTEDRCRAMGLILKRVATLPA